MAKRTRLDSLDARAIVTTTADIVGGALISIGTWLIYAPAGVIVAGVLIVAASVLSS